MIKALAWRIGCRLVSWAVKREGATSVRIDARYGETERVLTTEQTRAMARWN